MKFIRSLFRFCSDDQGVGSIWMLCLLPLFLVLAGFGMDGTAAFRTRDMLQSTADSSALAGALQLPTSGAASTNQQCAAVNKALAYAQANMSVAGFGNVLNSTYTNSTTCTPGDAVFGYWNGTTFTAPAPAGHGNAIQVTVKTATANSNPYPTSFLALIGKSSWDIVATAIAMNGIPKPICLLSLSTTANPGILSDGLPHSNLSGCTIASNSSMTCHGAGSDGGAEFGITVGANSGCGRVEATGPIVSVTQYSSMLDSTTASNALASCAGTFAGTTWNSAPTLTSSPLVVCGDLTLGNNITLAPAVGGSQIIIENGSLITNSSNGNLSTSNNNGLTIAFSGTNASGATHQVTGDGTLTFSGPPSGTWKQMALYQDPDLVPTGSGLLDFVPRNPGQKFPDLNIQGIIYMPHGLFELHGSLSNNNAGACIVLVADTIVIKGTGDVVAQQACTNAPTTLVPISRLVQ
jgi:Flp pilus assembly protein TadG